MSYCVNCGVELHAGVKHCPLCGTPVYNPNELRRDESAPFFAPEKEVVAPASRREAALLLSAMLCSVAVCCGVLNFFLRTSHTWSLYIVGAAVMLWIWLVLPLLAKKMPPWVALPIDVAAVGLYIFFIAVDLDGLVWYRHLVLPGAAFSSGDFAGALLSAAGSPPQDADHRHIYHQCCGALSSDYGVFCRLLFPRRLAAGLVPHCAGSMRGPDCSAAGCAPCAFSAGGSQAALSYVSGRSRPAHILAPGGLFLL